MKCALYSRVSLKNGSQDTENQALILREFAQRQGWQIVEYEDQASGKSTDREAFTRLFEDARKKKFDLVLFWALDRFSREGALKTLTLLQELQSYGVGWKSYSEQYLDSLGPFGEAIIAILAVLARQERIRISERAKAGLERAKSQGKQLGRRNRIFDREELCRLKAEGVGWREIGERLGISKDTARNEWKRIQEGKSVTAVLPREGQVGNERLTESVLDRARRLAREKQGQ